MMKSKNGLITRIAIIFAVILVVIIGGVIFLSLHSGTTNQDLTALLSQITGGVEVKNNPQTAYQPVSDGFLLKTIMQLQTQQNGRVRLDLSNKSIVRLGPTTIFSLDPPTSATGGVLSQIELQAGKIWIVLNGGSLNVNTPAGLASVRGSYLGVWMDPTTNIITVTCLEGNCGFQDKAGDIDMTSGQKVVSSNPNVVPPLQKMDLLDIQSWLDNSPESIPIVTQIASLVATSTPSSTLSGSGSPTTTVTGTASVISTQTPLSTFTNALTPSPIPTDTPTETPTTSLSFIGPGNATGTLNSSIKASATTQVSLPTSTSLSSSTPSVTAPAALTATQTVLATSTQGASSPTPTTQVITPTSTDTSQPSSTQYVTPTSTDTTQPTVTQVFSPTVTNTPRPTITQSLTPIPTPTATTPITLTPTPMPTPTLEPPSPTPDPPTPTPTWTQGIY